MPASGTRNPDGGYPPDRRTSAGSLDIQRIPGGYPPSGLQVPEAGVNYSQKWRGITGIGFLSTCLSGITQGKENFPVYVPK